MNVATEVENVHALTPLREVSSSTACSTPRTWPATPARTTRRRTG
jgi:hypothetical protein